MWNFLFMQDIMNAYVKTTIYIYQRPFHGKAAITVIRAPFFGFPSFSQDELHQQMIIVRSQCEKLPEPETVIITRNEQ